MIGDHLTIPNEMDLSNIGKVIVVEGHLKSGGSQEVSHIGVLESISTIGNSVWSARLSGGIKISDSDKYYYDVVHVKEPKIELACTRKPSHL